jgi:hypothetical protein
MKALPSAIGFTLASLLVTSAAWSQQWSPSGLRQPGSATQVSYDYWEQAPTAPAPAPNGDILPGPTSAQSPQVTDAVAPAMVYPGDPPQDKPWTLPQPALFQRYGITLGGWLEQGITFNGEDPHNRFNGPVACNDRDGEYQLNQLWFFLNRPVNTEGSGWDLGGRIDMIYGSDFRYGISHGLEDRINSLDQYYGLVIPQVYGEVGFNDLTVRVGHFAGILSYEQVPSVANFFYSHSYTMCYSDPILVTGALATYKLCDHWSITGGFHRGWMMWEDNNDDLNFMGGITWTSDDKKGSVTFAVDNGAADPAGERNRFLYTVIGRRQISDRFLYVLQHDLGVEDDGDPRTGSDAQWYSLAQYFIYTLNTQWSAGLRFEWFRDEDGARVAGVGNLTPGHGWDALPGFAGDFYELSLGVNWRPTPNMVLRPELRWDWYDGSTNLQGQLPFDDGNSDKQFLLGMDFILTY